MLLFVRFYRYKVEESLLVCSEEDKYRWMITVPVEIAVTEEWRRCWGKAEKGLGRLHHGMVPGAHPFSHSGCLNSITQDSEPPSWVLGYLGNNGLKEISQKCMHPKKRLFP